MVDNEDKRRSAINMIAVTTPPLANGGIDSGDRVQASWIYRGIVLDGISTGYRCRDIIPIISKMLNDDWYS